MLHMELQEVQGIGEVSPEPEDNDWQTAAPHGEPAIVSSMQRIARSCQDMLVFQRTKRF